MKTKGILFVTLLTVGCAQTTSFKSMPPPGREILDQTLSDSGVFDPSVADTPAKSRAWMSYSAVNKSQRWPNRNTRVISTRLAYSDDQGRSWKDSDLVINAATDVELPGRIGKSGTWSNEVSTLVYDPWAKPSQRWKLFWHHYLVVNEDRKFENGWISVKNAKSPEELSTAKEVKLFGGTGYNSVNNIYLGMTRAPVEGEPRVQVRTLHPDLTHCAALSEPGAMATESGIYLSLGCYENHFLGVKSKIVLLKCASPCDVAQENSWEYLGTILEDRDARPYSADSFSASALYREANRFYLIVSPVTDEPIAGAYNGCLVFQFTNLEKGQVDKSRMVKQIAGRPGRFNGACTYQSSLTSSGFILGEIEFADRPRFHIFSTAP